MTTPDPKQSGNAGDNPPAGGAGEDPPANGSAQGDQGGTGDVRDPEAVLAHNTELLAELKESRERLTTLESDEEARRTAALSAHEKAVEDADAAGFERARVEFSGKYVEQRVINAAADSFADPTDAVASLDLTSFDVEDGTALDDALAELLERKPHFAAKQKSGGLKQGPRGHVPSEDANQWLRGIAGG